MSEQASYSVLAEFTHGALTEGLNHSVHGDACPGARSFHFLDIGGAGGGEGGSGHGGRRQLAAAEEGPPPQRTHVRFVVEKENAESTLHVQSQAEHPPLRLMPPYATADIEQSGTTLTVCDADHLGDRIFVSVLGDHACPSAHK